jgi:hypothetical protein
MQRRNSVVKGGDSGRKVRQWQIGSSERFVDFCCRHLTIFYSFNRQNGVLSRFADLSKRMIFIVALRQFAAPPAA